MAQQVSHNPETPDSIARAKSARDAERRRIEGLTGLWIQDNGLVTTRAYIIGCPRVGCAFAASARNEGRATRGLVSHMVKAHHAQEQHS